MVAGGHVVGDVAPDRDRRDHVLGALQDQRRLRTLDRSARLSDRKVTSRELPRKIGVGAAEALGELSPSSGRSALPMIAGAIALDQPR